MPAISLPALLSKKNESSTHIFVHRVHGSIIHNSQKVEVTQGSIDRWMDKQNVISAYNEVLYSLKKEGDSDTSYILDEPWGQ